MLKIKNLQGQCQSCGQPIEFHAESIGAIAACPHCGQPTELQLAAPKADRSAAPTKAIVFMVLAGLILAGGLIGVNLALKRAKQLQAVQISPVATTLPSGPFVDQELAISRIQLQQEQGSAVTHAIGTLTNLADRQRFGVKVELELFDTTGSKVGYASDYRKIVEANAVWTFRALVLDKRSATAKVVRIGEDP